MNCQKCLQQMIGATLVMLLLVGCGTPAGTPTPVPPTPTPTPSTGKVDIYPKSCTSRYCVNLTSSGKCEIIQIAQGRQIWESDTQQN